MSARMGCLNASWTIHPSLSIATTGSSRPIKIKKRLLRLIEEDKKKDKENWEHGSETVAEISDESNGEETCFYGYGSYSYYQIDYTAEILSNIEELNDEK